MNMNQLGFPRLQPLFMKNTAANAPSTRPDLWDSCPHPIVTDLATVTALTLPAWMESYL